MVLFIKEMIESNSSDLKKDSHLIEDDKAAIESSNEFQSLSHLPPPTTPVVKWNRAEFQKGVWNDNMQVLEMTSVNSAQNMSVPHVEYTSGSAHTYCPYKYI